MTNWFENLTPVAQALLATLFTWGVTALGAATVFVFRGSNRRLLDLMLGAVAVVVAEPLLPYALSFAAGAMIFVIVEEVIPESQGGGNTDLATLGAIGGFTIMMVLDMALG